VQFASVNDVVIHYDFQRAADEKPVLVFINSLGTDFRIWDDVRERLRNDASILVYDKRGHGLSDIGNTPYTIELLAAELTALLDKLSIRRAIICGLSIGGLIAQAVFAARPDLVAGLVLSNTAHKIGTPDMWDARIAAIQQDGLASIIDTTMSRWFTPAYRRPDNFAYRAYCNMFLRQPLNGYAATCVALRAADLTEAAKSITVPTLCVAGAPDGSAPPAIVRELADLIPEADYAEISACGHIPCVEQPDAYVSLLRNFLSNRFEHGE